MSSQNDAAAKSGFDGRRRFTWAIDPEQYATTSLRTVVIVLAVAAAYPVVVWSNVGAVLAFLQPISAASANLLHPTLLIYAPLLLFVLAIILGVGGLRASSVGLRSNDVVSGVVVTILAWLALQLAVIVAQLRAGVPVTVNANWSSPGVIASLAPLLGQLFGNALYEELVFRGFLLVQLHVMVRRIWSITPRVAFAVALVTSQLLFALVHVPNRIVSQGVALGDLPLAIVSPFVIGLILALVYYRSGNLFVAIGLHAFMNTPTLVVGQRGLGATYAVGLTVIVALAWPWLSRLAMVGRRVSGRGRISTGDD